MTNSYRWRTLLCAGLALVALPLQAEIFRGNAPTEKDPRVELEAAFAAANLVMRNGPTDVDIAGQAILKLPEGLGYVPLPQAARVMEAMGNQVGATLVGVILPIATDQDAWYMTVNFINAGYVRDDDAKHWDSDELLEDLKVGADNANVQRRERHLPEMDILGWVEPPQYDASTHRLFWSVSSRQRSEIDSQYSDVNFNTLMLGREGFISINLVTDITEVESLKSVVKSVLNALEFNPGRRYDDFNSNTDKIAEFGLAVLVAGVAAQKLGLVAMLIGLVAKAIKLIGLGVAIAVGIMGRVFWKKKKKGTKKKAAQPQKTHPHA